MSLVHFKYSIYNNTIYIQTSRGIISVCRAELESYIYNNLELEYVVDFDLQSNVKVSNKLPNNIHVSNLDRYLVCNLIEEKIKIWETNKKPYK